MEFQLHPLASSQDNFTFLNPYLPNGLFHPHQLDESFLARLYISTGRAIAVTTLSASASALASSSASASLKTLKFLVKVFNSLYLLNPWMDLVDTLPDVRYWSDSLCYTILTYIGHLEVKVTDF